MSKRESQKYRSWLLFPIGLRDLLWFFIVLGAFFASRAWYDAKAEELRRIYEIQSLHFDLTAEMLKSKTGIKAKRIEDGIEFVMPDGTVGVVSREE